MTWLKENHLEYFRKEGIKIGKNCLIDNHTFLDLHGKLIIGDNVIITAWAKILTHDASAKILGKKDKRFVTIKDGAFIGLNAIILDGITIGKNSIIGAGSVVTKNVPNKEVWAGNPAKKIGEIKHE